MKDAHLPIQAFEGFIESIERTPTALVIRLVDAEPDPCPASPAACLISIEAPEDRADINSLLTHLRTSADCVYAWIESNTQLRIRSDYGDELGIRGADVQAVEAAFESRDYERLAKLNYACSQSQAEALSEYSAQHQRIRKLLQDQHQRVVRKAERHLAGGTAHTLYGQQLDFISRLLRETED